MNEDKYIANIKIEKLKFFKTVQNPNKKMGITKITETIQDTL